MTRVVVYLCALFLMANAEEMADLNKWAKANMATIVLDQIQTLEPIKKELCGSKVIALGENSHFIKEFFILRHQLIRFMVESCGVDTFAYEFGFAEGEGINRWIHGEGAEGDIKTYLSHFYYPKELEATLLWLREYNKAHGNRVSFLGLDVPRNGGSYLPALDRVRNLMKPTDPEALPLLDEIRAVAKRIDFFSTAQAAFAYQSLNQEERARLSASLSQIKMRLENLAPLYPENAFLAAMHHIKGLLYLDYNIRAMAEMLEGKGVSGDMGARDIYMADTLMRHLKAFPDSRVVLVAHNAHLQKVPVAFEGFVSAYPMGERLAKMLGSDYRAFGITSAQGHTAALYPDQNATFGFRVDNHPLENPEEGSVEKLMMKNGEKNLFLSFGNVPPDGHFPDKIRLDSIYLHQDMRKAFDGLFLLERSSLSETVFR